MVMMMITKLLLLLLNLTVNPFTADPVQALHSAILV